MNIETGIHGVNTFAEYIGPGKLINVDDIPYTDVVGLKKGWGTIYRGVANTSNWFHIPIPTIISTTSKIDQNASRLMKLNSIIFHFQSFGTAKIRDFHVWEGNQRIFVSNNINAEGDFRNRILLNKNLFTINSNLEPGFNVSISLGVDFGRSDSNILFQGAGASFIEI